MRKWLLLAGTVVLVLAVVMPASAQTWIQLRYWPTSNRTIDFNNTFNSSLWGVTLRRTFGGGDWAVSLNWDTGNIANWTGGGGSPGSFNRFWNINLHRNRQVGNGTMSIYGGYFSAALEDPSFPWYIRLSGWHVGADGRFPLRQNWYVVGDVSYAPRQNGEQLNWNLEGVVTMPSSLLNYRVGIAYVPSATWGAEIGYRWINWDYDPAIMCGGASNCGVRWSGAYFGLNFMAP